MASTSYLKNVPLKGKMPGSWDVEVCHDGEANLYKHYKSCQKHPDHKEFIPVDTFDITHLPIDYQDRDIVEYIKLVAQLTVRLTVRYVSPNRPATVPGTDTPYPFYQNRGEQVIRVGTGLITNVDDAYLNLKTATHVVFDHKEAQHTSLHLFYNNGDQPDVCSTAIELECDLDDCEFTGNTITDEVFLCGCKISDTFLLQEMRLILLKFYKLRKIIINRLLKFSHDRHHKLLTFIVSHPHGCSKTISIGRCVEVDDNLDDVRFLYTTPTCPGSSGAAVFCLDKQAWNLYSVHIGTWREDTSLNFGSCRFSPSLAIGFGLSSAFRLVHLEIRLPDIEWSHFHERLLPEFNYNLMLDYISTWSHLHVLVEVEYVSEQRPKNWPGSKLLYPLYEERGSREERLGSGWVDRVDIYPNQSSRNKTCDCNKCRNSLTPERDFAHIYILTSTSLVFDQTEATKTKLDYVNYMLDMLSGTQPVCNNVETDRSQLVFVTHDLVFAEKLNILLEHVSFLKDKIQDKLSHRLSASPICIKICSVVAYSIGRCVRVGKHLVYTNKAEEYDVGAPVIVLGNKNLHVDVSGHTEKLPHDPKLGYSRYLNYQFKSTRLKALLPVQVNMFDNLITSESEHDEQSKNEYTVASFARV